MPPPDAFSRMTADPAAELLRWYAEMGADEAIGEEPFVQQPVIQQPGASSGRPPEAAGGGSVARPLTPPLSPEGRGRNQGVPSFESAEAQAAAAQDLESLEAAVRAFTGCALRQTATNTVFADGNPQGPVMVIGEAPGADEDRIGKPFVGRSGQLLDRMLATIGLDRKVNTLITNAIYWRPPGNRKPSPAEAAACLPFVRRHIALVKPSLIVLCGGTAASALLGVPDGITKLRGRWFELRIPELDHPIPSICLYHPSYLLRSPERKKETWRDLLLIQSKLEEVNKNSSRT